MEERSDTLNPLHTAFQQVVTVVFTLCSASRSLPGSSRYYWKRTLAARGILLPGRLSFWLRLLTTAHLLSGPPSHPTCLTPFWFGYSPRRQLLSLLQAWIEMPQTRRVQRRRERLIERIRKYDLDFSAWEQRELHSLIPLGMWHAGQVSPLGRWLLLEESDLPPSTAPIQPWWLSENCLWAAPQHDYTLLWELESFLAPYLPGQYLLTPPALRLAIQRGDPEEFISLLERGTEAPLPSEMAAQIRQTPSARLLKGQVLEFDSPQELAALRQTSPALRKYLDLLLSPRHVYLPPHLQEDALKSLARHAFLILPPASEVATGQQSAPTGSLDNGEIADLYILALTAQESQWGAGVSPDLVEKLAALLPPALRRAARHTALKAIERVTPPTPFTPAEEPQAGVLQSSIDTLQRAIAQEEMVVITYRKSAKYPPERRRVTPLLIEQRGTLLYLIAYCHERRANRTFRMDRVVVSG